MEWTMEEAQAKQSLEQRLRQRPGDRMALVALGKLLASKRDFSDANALFDRSAVGIDNDPACGNILRSLALGKLLIWRGMGRGPPGLVNYSADRREFSLEAVGFFERAVSYPENREPAVLLEAASGKLASSDLIGALRDFSFVISNHPDYEYINVAIFRAVHIKQTLSNSVLITHVSIRLAYYCTSGTLVRQRRTLRTCWRTLR